MLLLPFDNLEKLVLCNGSSFSISGHEGLYNLLGRRLGAGDDRNFVLPDLRAAAPPKYNYFLSTRGVFPPRP
ncbi:MAG: phage tail protein [Pyrinomonadaceae bacterium]